jgi:glycine/D-amino acid oxidase-like deaminating enzyme
LFAKRIIFCEGYQAMHNPYFAYLPFQAVKGEILTIAHNHPLPDAILNYGNWLIPLPMTASPLKDWQSCSDLQQARIGATFDWENLNNQSTELGKYTLLNGFNTLLADFECELLDQQANVRPCTLDKQPFIGFHPQYSQLAIFNGFGAKGSLQIPFYSQSFARVLMDNVALDSTSNIQRHYDDYFTA